MSVATKQTRRDLIKKVGAGVAVGAIGTIARTTPAAADASAQQAVYNAYQVERNKYPWFPPITVVDRQAGAFNMTASWNNQTWHYEIAVPPAWTSADVTQKDVAHETGHIMEAYVRNARGPVWEENPPDPAKKGPWDLLKEWLRYVGSDQNMVDTRFTDTKEMFADSYARSQGYPPNYSSLVPYYNFNQAQFLNFLNQIRPPSEDGYMWVSNDFPISLDANGNYFGLVDIPPGFLYAPATGQVKMQGFAQRTGIPTDGTAELPDCTFWVPSDLNGTKGRLMVRGDPIRFTTGYFKVGVWQ